MSKHHSHGGAELKHHDQRVILICNAGGHLGLGDRVADALIQNHPSDYVRIGLNSNDAIPAELKKHSLNSNVSFVEINLQDDNSAIEKGFESTEEMPLDTVLLIPHFRGDVAASVERLLPFAARANHVVLLSMVGVPTMTGKFGKAMRKVEELVSKGTKSYTIVRMAHLMESFLYQKNLIKDKKQVLGTCPVGATFPVITLGDMARALAQICHTSNLPAFKNTTLMLAHAENHSYKELVALMSATLKENIQYKQVTSEEWKESMISLGMSTWKADAFLDMFEDISKGHEKQLAKLSHDFENLAKFHFESAKAPQGWIAENAHQFN